MNKIELIELEKDINTIYKEVGVDKVFNYLNYYFIFTIYKDTDVKYKDKQIKTQPLNLIKLTCIVDNNDGKDIKPIEMGLSIQKVRLYLLRTQLTFKDYYFNKYNVNDIVYTLSVIANINRNFKQLGNQLEHSSKQSKRLKI